MDEMGKGIGVIPFHLPSFPGGLYLVHRFETNQILSSCFLISSFKALDTRWEKIYVDSFDKKNLFHNRRFNFHPARFTPMRMAPTMVQPNQREQVHTTVWVNCKY
jgi:hypothetical protein